MNPVADMYEPLTIDWGVDIVATGGGQDERTQLGVGLASGVVGRGIRRLPTLENGRLSTLEPAMDTLPDRTEKKLRS